MREPLHALREALAERLMTLLQIPSVTGDEAALAARYQQWAETRVPGAYLQRFGNNLVLGEPHDNRPVIALVGHLDTVPPHPSDAPVRREGNRVFGRGASDMKAGLAVAELLFERHHLSEQFALMLVLYDREEGPFANNGLGTLLEEVRSLTATDLAIVLEPTANRVEAGALGTLHAKVTVRGRAAHSGRPWQGENAIYKALPLLNACAALPPETVEVGGLSFRQSLSVTLLHAGTTKNVIPDRCELNLNYRFAAVSDPLSSSQAAVERVRALTAGYDMEIIDLAPPGSLPTHNPHLLALLAACGTPLCAKEAWTDVARLGLHNIDAVNFGPGDPAQAHQANEQVDLEALTRAFVVLEQFLTTRR